MQKIGVWVKVERKKKKKKVKVKVKMRVKEVGSVGKRQPLVPVVGWLPLC